MHFGRHADVIERAVAINKLGFGDFREIMIFGGDPEDGHSLRSPLRKAAGKFHGGEGFVDGIKRTGEKTGLLSRYRRQAPGISEQFDIRASLRSGAPTLIHPRQGIAERAAIRFMCSEHFRSTRRKFMVKADCGGIETSQGNRIFQVVEEETALLWNAIKRDRLHA